MAINLLPTDLAPTGSVVKLASNLRKIAIAGFILFLISVVSLIVFFFFISTQLNSSIARQDQLKRSIESLGQTEQRLMLVRDRLNYTKQILAKDNAIGDVRDLKGLALSLPESVQINQLDISKSKVELVILSPISSGFSQSLATLFAADLYEKVVLASFSFNPAVGYLANLELSNP